MELDLTQQFKELRGDIQSIHLRLDQHDQRFDKMREVTDRLEDNLDYVKGLVRLTAEQMMAKNQRLDQMRDAMGGLGVQLESLMDMLRLVAERLGGPIDSHGDLEQRVTTLEKHRNQTDIRLQLLEGKV